MKLRLALSASILFLTTTLTLAQLTYPQLQEVFTVDAALGDQAGISVALSGNGRTIVVGAHQEDANGSNSGAAYIFQYDSTTLSWVQRAKLAPWDGSPGDKFGTDVAISTDASTVIVGAPFNDTSSGDAGAAYIFEKGSGWASTSIYSQKLLPTGPTFIDMFGISVDISANGSTAIVGAYWDYLTGFQRGSAYVFERVGSWTSGITTSKLTASDTADNDYFGEEVAISGDASTVIIGTLQDDNQGNGSGSAYIFERGAGWTTTSAFTARLNASDGAPNDNFGRSVDISADGSTVVVGAYRDDDLAWNGGGAYVYERGGGWVTTSTFTAKLLASDATETNAWFGYSAGISANGSTVLVSSVSHFHTTPTGSGFGAVYLFKKPGGGWVSTSTPDHEMNAFDNMWDGAGFGSAGDISANAAIVISGASHNDDIPQPVGQGNNSGSTYVFGSIPQPSSILNPDQNGDGDPDTSTAITVTSPPSRPWTLTQLRRGTLTDPGGTVVTEITTGSGMPPPGTLYWVEDPPGTYTIEFDSNGSYDLTFGDGFEELRIAHSPELPPGTDGSLMTLELLGPDLGILWDTGCSTAVGYQILYGSSFPLAPPLALDGAVCSIGTPRFVWSAAPEPALGEILWWLVTATDGDSVEGPWGRDSSGSERYGTSGFCSITDKALDNTCGQ